MTTLTQPKNILLVEDEALIAMQEAWQLQKEGYAVITAYKGEDAIAIVKAGEKRIDLILMDIDLGQGRMDGTQAAQIILQLQQIPIVFLSSHTEPEIVARTEQITSYGYVVKNSGITVLAASIKMAFKLHTANQSLQQEIGERKLIEEKLRLSEARLQHAAKAAAIGVWDWDVANNNLVWDDSMYHLYGLHQEDFEGAYLAWLSCVHPQDAARVDDEIQAALRGEKEYAPEFRIVRPDGSVRYMQANSQTFRDDDGRPLRMIGTNIDITERKLAEEALRESQRRYQLVFENSGTTNAIFDTHCRLIMQNGRSEKALGVKPGEALGKTALEIFGPERGPLVTERMLNVLASGISEVFETEFDLPTGKLWFRSVYQPIFDEQGQLFGQQVISQDITAQKQAEELQLVRMRLLEFAAAHGLDEVLQLMLDEIGRLTHSPIGFYHFVEADQKTLSLQMWSTRTLQEFCKAEGKGQHYDIDRAGVWVDCVHERRPIIHNDYATLAHRKGLPEGHAAVIRELVVPILREGRIVAILGVGNKPSDYTEKDIDLVAYLADMGWEIAERKRAEDSLQRALADKELLMRELQHRVKNSLNIINSLVRMEELNLSEEPARAVFANTRARIDAISAVYGHLDHSGTVSQVHLASYLLSLVQGLSRAYISKPGSVKIETQFADIELNLKHAMPVGIILNELVTNALKYGFPAGFTPVGGQGIIRVALSAAGSAIQLSVTDNGIGPAAVQETRTGTGLGLVEMLTQQMGGELTIDGSQGMAVGVRLILA